MRVVLVHNPGAGDASAPDGKALKKLIRDAGHDVEYCSARGRKWLAAAKARGDVVAVAGGDGTVTRVACHLIGRGVPLAVLPLGTANNVSKSLGVRHVPIEALIAGWSSAKRKRCDAGVISGPQGSQYFIEAVGAGLFARAMPAADANATLEGLKDAEARATYAQQMMRERLKACRPLPLDITVDGENCSGDYLLFEAMNLEFVGPNLYLAPDSIADDGRLDVVLIGERDRAKFDRYLETWQAGVTRPPDFTTLKGARIEIEWTGFALHIDDRVIAGRKRRLKNAERLVIGVERDALEFLVPSRGDAPDSHMVD
ncbi:MAG TPA: diacylglycerol kinase family protein [Burkholderiales bacterium]|jgi:diacylglycerol kinase family enzyme|nr:diacylglycerol kinase family protein [Burkholderiales bacterium]